ncbi:MAG TPA: glycosyltransferase family A protein [Candidatus Acidoferrum sp.]|nr:glycosyltransferase family A protein [Candidatus Acidoferrum sp.]
MNSRRFRASVLIDTYNHEKYIEQAVVSAMEQDFPASDYEIVVVDDGSTDRTPEIVRKFAPRVRLLTKKNGGQASAFNAAVPELRGEIIAFLDGDDWWRREKLSAAVAAFAEHPDAAAVGHGFFEFCERTGKTKVCVPERPGLADLTTSERAHGAFQVWDFFRTSGIAVRREILDRLLPIPEGLVFCADTLISGACIARGVWACQEPLMYYRVHGENLCAFERTGDDAKARRRSEMHELLFELLEPMLVKMGVRRDVAWALLYPYFTELMRFKLSRFGGSRLNAFRTEMRAFAAEYPNPSLRYRIFKHTAVGAATLLLPPRTFYRAKEWYAGKNLGRLRERVAKSA